MVNGKAELLTSYGQEGEAERERDRYAPSDPLPPLCEPHLLKFLPPPQIVPPAGDQAFNA